MRAGSNVSFTELPTGVKSIPSSCFAGCENIGITEFGVKPGDVIGNTYLTSIGQAAFNTYTIPGRHSSITDIYVWSSVTSIESSAFKNYGKHNGDESQVILHTDHAEGAVSWDAATIGVARIEYNYQG